MGQAAFWSALAALGLGAALLPPAAGGTTGGEAIYLGTHVWHEPWSGFGGFSGLVLSTDGTTFTALSDRAFLVFGHLTRDDAGVVTGVEASGPQPLLDPQGDPMTGSRADSEGLAIGPDGTVWISFEGSARVRRQDPDGARPSLIPSHPDFERLRSNSALEALAADARGTLYAIPELPFRREGAFRVYRFRDGAWDVAFRLPVRDGFAVTDADVGPDGRLYVLERDFTGLGFRSRLRRVDVDGTGEEILLTSSTGAHDNLEGLDVWSDGEGLRATMISDDNLFFFQETQFVDYRLPD
ncbi:ABC-type cobalamin/Fe3+-siderophores transport system, ATPase component [Rubellimicrobium mesophilum DSM 19309]|uniref:ABC-type cobalamin/Fe3+-siderophores transport system, ATPase component n=1 Tax=Rubellimicrobium mesophilum DSM 19309 TaxID=442562 RepID=A0A017HKH6_9RHOB|nr:esterase-like activity of phytase family protein [Rubellimicrobium mesophilum]EYD74861.1 ABC-type cobalamin/Fe3+-siderophores transport system, ATPase component [Rubellimicrobium mesophilum DSM 19309]